MAKLKSAKVKRPVERKSKKRKACWNFLKRSDKRSERSLRHSCTDPTRNCPPIAPEVPFDGVASNSLLLLFASDNVS